MRKAILAVWGSLALGLLTTTAQATTYTGYESFNGATVDLSISTDGVSGPLVESDITAFNIAINDSSGSVDLTKANSGLDFFGGALQATADDLVFDFDTPGYAYALFQLHGYGSSDALWCPATKGCFPGNTAPAIGVSTQPGDSPVEQESESGTVVLASVPSAAPEPGLWALMTAAIGVVGLALRRTRLVSVRPAAVG